MAAAVTINSRKQRRTIRSGLTFLIFDVTLAADTDWLDTGLKQVLMAIPVGVGTAAVNVVTISGERVTFKSGGAEANVKVLVIGIG